MSDPPYPPDLRAARRLAAVLVPARLWADGAWGLALPGGLSVAQVVGAAGVVAAAVVAAPGARRWPAPARWILGGIAASLAVGALRAASPAAALSNGLHLAGPFALWALGFAAADPALVAGWRRAAWLPVGVSLAAWAAGQRADLVLNGWPRLVGWYGNVHAHAAAMAVIAASSLLAAALRTGRRPADLALGAASLACLAATLVRGGVVFVVVALLAGAPRSRAARALAALVVFASLALVASRWSDLWSLATGTAPAGGWGALGSHRARIWAESLAAFLRGPPLDVLLGRGLGGQYGLHRHLDPHQEWLSLLYQLGPAGPALWLAAAVAAARAARGPGGPEARGLLAAAVVVGCLGNDVLYRASLIWWVAGAAGLAAGAVTPGAPGAPPPTDAPASRAG